MLNVAILDMQPITPAVGGGRLRLLGLYHHLGPGISAKYVGTYDWPGEPPRTNKLSDCLVEQTVPLSDEHHAAAAALSHLVQGKTVIDVAFPDQCHLSPAYLAAVKAACHWANVVIFSHPWVYPVAESFLRDDQIVIYDSHNVEAVLRAQLFDAADPPQAAVLRTVIDAEYAAGSRADLILACSEEDRRTFENLYGWEAKQTELFPNGVMARSIVPAAAEQKRRARATLALDAEQVVAFFIGSAYPPNLEAAQFIITNLAPQLPQIRFVVAGGVGRDLRAASDVIITGPLSDEERLQWLHASDLAINPMFSGSGTNIKMFDFMAAGLPIVSTHVGARGITQVDGGGLILAAPEDFCARLQGFLDRKSDWEIWGDQNRRWAERDFAWESISRRLGQRLLGLAREQTDRHEGGAQHSTTPLICHVSTVGHKCGIGEYTMRLMDGFDELGLHNWVITGATPRLRPVGQGYDGIVGWFYDDEQWKRSKFADDLGIRISEQGADLVLIQYHPGFYSAEALQHLCAALRALNLAVVVEIHNLAIAEISVLKRLEQTCVLLVHSAREARLAAAESLQVEVVPLLIPTNSIARPRKARNWQRQPPLIVTTGFLRHHKGVPQLIEAMPLVRRVFPGARLLVKCALFPSLDSELEHRKCIELMDRLDLHDVVTLDTEFSPVDSLHDAIAAGDLAVLPYDESSEGSSAAASTCLAAGLPVLISQSMVFEELRPAADLLAGTSSAAIADAVVATLSDSARYEALAEKGVAFVGQRMPRLICQRILGLAGLSTRQGPGSAKEAKGDDLPEEDSRRSDLELVRAW